jgi:hypothetical protein
VLFFHQHHLQESQTGREAIMASPTRRARFSLLISAIYAAGCLHFPLAMAQQALSPEQFRALARNAYLYAYRIVAADQGGRLKHQRGG